MRAFTGLMARIRATIFRRRMDREMDDELRFHLEMETEKNMRLGLEPCEARRKALVSFGGMERYRHELRADRRVPLAEDVLRDQRFAFRALRKTPGMSLGIVTALGLGIGVCTAIYAMAAAVASDTVPFPDSQRLFSVELAERGSFSSPTLEEFEAWESRLPTAVGLAAHAYTSQPIGTSTARVESWSLRVTDQFFQVLRPHALLGRGLVPSDFDPVAPPVAVASERLWRELLGADSSAIGGTVYLAAEPHTLVGVLSVGQEFPPIVDLWLPLAPAEGDMDRGVGVVGRAPPGTTTEDIRAALQAAHEASALGRGATRAVMLPLAGRDNPAAGPAFLLLWIAVGSILVIGVANAAGLMVTRSLLREHELAIRSSLGASERRIAFGHFSESFQLATVGAIVGVLVAWLGIEALRSLVPPSMSRQILGWEQLGLEGGVLAFAVLLALMAATVCGLSPWFGGRRQTPTGALQGSVGRATPSRKAIRALGSLVAGEVALSTSLLIAGGLLAQNLYQRVAVDSGFATADIASMSWILPGESDSIRAKQPRLLEALGAVAASRPWAISSSPAVAAAGLSGTRSYRFPSSDPEYSDGRAGWRSVSPGYTTLLQIGLRSGRALSERDTEDAPRVAVVSESFARRHWDEASAVGHEVVVADESWTIVGVVGDVRTFRSGETVEPTIYVPQAQAPTQRGFLFVSNAGGLATLRQDLWSAAPEIALGPPSTLSQAIDDVYRQERILAVLVGAYALTALLITFISLYAVVGHLVCRHHREYGVRLALGASPMDIVRRATLRGLKAAALGGAVGLVLAAALARLMSSLLVDIRATDPAVFIGIPAVVLLLLAVASYLPARRAARQEPSTILGG